MLDGQPEIGVTIHQVTAQLDAGHVVNAATIPIEPFDTLTSLALKAHVVGNDLLVRSVADYAHGKGVALGGYSLLGLKALRQIEAGLRFDPSATDAVQIHGANGCHEDFAVSRYYRDAKVMEIIEGSSQIQQVTIARFDFQEL